MKFPTLHAGSFRPIAVALIACAMTVHAILIVTEAGASLAPTLPRYGPGSHPWEEANGPVFDGVEVQVDFPESKRTHNTETKGLGNCVWTSILHSAYWQGIEELYPIISWLDEGGGYPEKVEEVLRKFAPGVEYVQYEGPDPEPIIRLALRTGRLPCITLGYGKLYGWQKISHMVNVTAFVGSGSSGKAAILDNNDEKHDTWMGTDDLLERMKSPSGNAWVIVFLSPSPPPRPRN